MNFDDPVQYKIDYTLSPKEQWLAVPKERRVYLIKVIQYHVEHFTKLLSETPIDDPEYLKYEKNLSDTKKAQSLIESYENSSCETVPVSGID
jgi:hypothetical protein